MKQFWPEIDTAIAGGKAKEQAVIDFVDLFRRGEAEIVKKQLPVVVKEIDAEKRILRFAITTEDIDRDGDSIKAAGWVLENYLKNPVMLWAHEHHVLPVAKTLALTVQEQQVVADVQFAMVGDISSTPENPHDHVKFIDTLYLMYKHGYMNAVSVGLIPLEFEPRLDSTGRQTGHDIVKQELLEFSAVPVPSNPNALRLAALEKSIDKKSLELIKTASEPTALITADMIESVEIKSSSTREHLDKCRKSMDDAEGFYKKAADCLKEACFHHQNAMESMQQTSTGSEATPGKAVEPEPPKEDVLDLEKVKTFLAK